jgi:hypothetical protein
MRTSGEVRGSVGQSAVMFGKVGFILPLRVDPLVVCCGYLRGSSCGKPWVVVVFALGSLS